MENQKSQPTTIRKTSFPDSSLLSHLEYKNGQLYVTYKKNGLIYAFTTTYEKAMEIYGAPSVGKAVIALGKDIKGVLQEEEE